MTQVRRPPERRMMETSFFERLNYYFGKLLTVDDFRREQDYLNEKRWMLNRFGIGWGVLHGLDVRYVGDGCIEISPGFALDKYGHEIWVAEAHRLELAEYLREAGIEVASDSPPVGTCFYVYLTYTECFTEPAPVTVDACGDLETNCAYGRVRESYRFKVLESAPPAAEPDMAVDSYGCEVDCYRFLHEPSGRTVQNIPERDPCVDIPLARICWSEDCGTQGWQIDNSSAVRKLAFSSEALGDLIECLKQEVWRVRGARYDRKRFVPLLVQTIEGVRRVDGKIRTVTMYRRHPIRLTTDGSYIWITDRDSHEIIRMDRQADLRRPFGEIIETPPVRLTGRSWGLAYDGHHMWVTHPDHKDGEEGDSNEYRRSVGVTGINVCRPADREADRRVKGIRAKPREIVYTGEYLVVSHALSEPVPDGYDSGEEQKDHGEYNDEANNDNDYPENGSVQWLTIIDPKSCAVVAERALRLDRWTISEIRSMAYDGRAVWAVSHSTNGYGLRKITIRKDSSSEIQIEVDGPYDCNGDRAEDVTFDGTHIWVANNEGVAKIDIDTGKDIANALQREDQTAVAFDGMHVWTGEPAQGRVNRVDTHIAGSAGGTEIRGKRHESYHMSRICFDGTYFWAAAHEIYENSDEAYEAEDIDRESFEAAIEAAEESETSHRTEGFTRGLLHRLIP